MAVACLAAPGGAVAAVAGAGVEDGYRRRRERGARWGPWGEGEMDIGRRWRASRRLGGRERWWRGLGEGVAYGRRGEREARWAS